jgi:hypothetical protein
MLPKLARAGHEKQKGVCPILGKHYEIGVINRAWRHEMSIKTQ